MMTGNAPTIAAIATPAGSGGVGIVRISGGHAERILEQMVPGWPSSHPTHLMRLSRIVDTAGELIDEALAVIMRGPRSYTGDDVVELQCHGGPIVLRRVLDRALELGARIAEPGEFTRRAFLNGRLDLTQAEAVADLVNATTDAAHRLALEHLQGSLGEEIRGIVESLTVAAVLIEAALDFSHEEHVYQIERDEIGERIDGASARLQQLRAKFDQGRRQREGVRVVILGATNAGKSTLFNTLHGTDRAIVTEIEGTTRDFLEEEIQLEGVALRLIDTAGLRETEDRVEAIGIERSRELGERADLLLRVIDRSRPLRAEEREALHEDLRSGRPTLLICNKSDLPDGRSPEDQALCARFTHRVDCALGASPPLGTDALIDRLSTLARELTSGEGVLLSRARHLQGVVAAIDALARARQALEMEMEHELIAIDLREALDALGDITGKVRTDDILQRIFSEFCVGK
ncbi:tRNA uridine-5-carboxymethylaminomethyl(34) synthesis GTPase MnmE [Bradymonadaceae bacterium TMQ3]|uniref:tRNA modification GTPase MnmE n=1 Tax=Lujinxingia sediminis TaxID=2480984 RepID=A0ABY0CTY7_9DELT|nr:tRNA uridine-5-carboxymethylaminomethyl(34) synthesis GTPase MnmE [Lujinxingia sediminis]RDV37520.1 tRNA uridine-5-carboxymethylaminomethyl(34) synthesis GTPase MnmE [Bradymonadaceae bacterium TMQ3]RVU45790.1 tRNA uridine-5-carboxymethylaminomethyl(34) synthesis GTPase MnmE [Lujinxingia sediminis]TXC75077.1 tRNA uridine-5-carboxymethylaminomethyl(34) synthesis GTPase MnmE [Bradymonadales bacterium TMQ1]